MAKPSTYSFYRDDYERAVARHVRGELSDEEAAWLRDDPQKWYAYLVRLKQATEAQLAAHKAERIKQNRLHEDGLISDGEWADEKVAAERWRGKTVRFKTGIEAKMVDAKLLRDVDAREATFKSFADQERLEALNEVTLLRQLVRAHRDHHCGDACGDECVADLELWAVLDK